MVSLLAWKSLRRRSPQGDRLRRLGRAFHGLALLLILLVTTVPAWAGPKLEVSLDRNTISLGESAVLSMNFEDCSPSGMPNLAPIPNLEFGGQLSEQSYSLVGASMTRKTVYSLELHPTKAGNFTIPPIEVSVDGARLRSRPITLKVLNGNVPPPGGGPETAFVRIVPSTNAIYLGQTLPVELQCYCQDNVRNIQLPQFSSDDFIIGETAEHAPAALPASGWAIQFTTFSAFTPPPRRSRPARLPSARPLGAWLLLPASAISSAWRSLIKPVLPVMRRKFASCPCRPTAPRPASAAPSATLPWRNTTRAHHRGSRRSHYLENPHCRPRRL